MTQETHEQQMKARRSEILAAALEVFDAHGFGHTTMDMVAARAGIAKGSLYNYFSNKQDLFCQAFTETLSGDEADADAMIAQDRPAFEKLEWMMDRWFSRFGHFQKIGRLILEVMATAARDEQSPLSQVLQTMYAAWRQRLTTIIEQGKSAGQFQGHVEPKVAASLIMGVLDGVVIQAILKVGIQVDQEFLDALKRVVQAGLNAATPAAAEGSSL